MNETSEAKHNPVEHRETGREGAEEESLEDGTELGSIRIHNNVIAVIARAAALRVKGVVELAGGLVDGLAGMIGKRASDRGIRVEVQDSAVEIEMHVVLDFGARIPQVAWQMQNDVRRAVEQMTGKTVKAVHVIVQSVRMPEDVPEGGGEA